MQTKHAATVNDAISRLKAFYNKNKHRIPDLDEVKAKLFTDPRYRAALGAGAGGLVGAGLGKLVGHTGAGLALGAGAGGAGGYSMPEILKALGAEATGTSMRTAEDATTARRIAEQIANEARNRAAGAEDTVQTLTAQNDARRIGQQNSAPSAGLLDRLLDLGKNNGAILGGSGVGGLGMMLASRKANPFVRGIASLGGAAAGGVLGDAAERFAGGNR